MLLTSVTTVTPRTLENPASTRTDFEPPWWSYTRKNFMPRSFESYPLLLRSFFYPLKPPFCTARILHYLPSSFRRSYLDDEAGNGEVATEIHSDGSSGFLSSVMRYLPVDSNVLRRNPSSRYSFRRTICDYQPYFN